MCGRTACCRCSNDYKKATGFFDEKTGEYKETDWYERPNCNLQFHPSSNLCPTEATPVLLSGKHCQSSEMQLLQPMIWSIIPSWHKGQYNKHGMTTNNARIEGLKNSKLYSKALQNGQRCVVISDGFYEWKKCGKNKQPYFIYAPQDENIRVEDARCWESAEFDRSRGWKGPKVLKMAGLFDVWTSPDGEVIPCYTVITMASNPHFGWIHERMPAVLENEEAVQEWLDSDGLPADDALNLLKQSETLRWHQVTSRVGDSRYKSADCTKPMKSQPVLSAFFKPK
ncbi:hypothetical protein LSTR_LSTR010949 [Laodelphax striatellus]|uniref:Abasic site processing protein HMCES n=1 Tax=Laodelphax striatellus TaxID=195883 RepID=A0A482XVP0_LAOST|nr:hypothetical protein LSTR_LSTR010949 [Laodelphax striatellus]